MRNFPTVHTVSDMSVPPLPWKRSARAGRRHASDASGAFCPSICSPGGSAGGSPQRGPLAWREGDGEARRLDAGLGRPRVSQEYFKGRRHRLATPTRSRGLAGEGVNTSVAVGRAEEIAPPHLGAV